MLHRCKRGMWQFFLTIMPLLYNFSTKFIIRTWNVYTGTVPTGTVQLLALLLNKRVANVFTINILHSTVSSLPTMADAGLKTSFTQTSTSYGGLSWKHTESLSRSTNKQCTGSYRNTFTVAKVPTKVSASSTLDLQNMNNLFHESFHRRFRSQHHFFPNLWSGGLRTLFFEELIVYQLFRTPTMTDLRHFFYWFRSFSDWTASLMVLIVAKKKLWTFTIVVCGARFAVDDY